VNSDAKSEEKKKVSVLLTVKFSIYDWFTDIKSKITWQAFKEWVTAIISVFFIGFFATAIISVILNIVTMIIQYFPETIKVELISEILKMIMQVDGILIGLTGILFAQLIWTINSQQNVIYEDILSNPWNPPTAETNKNDPRVQRIKNLQKKRRLLILSMLAAVIIYIGSIFYSLGNIAWTQEQLMVKTLPYLYMPLLLLISGVITSALLAGWVSLIPTELEEAEG